MLAIVDYGGGNIGSLIAALRRRGAHFSLSDDPLAFENASALILPGDGAFGATMQALQERGLDRAILRHIELGRAFLGICVGMQVLFEESDEFGASKGLGVLRGRISRFANAPRIPHMGWNRLEVTADHPFVGGLGDEEYAYFLHSYRAAVGEDTVAACSHGERFSAIVARDHIMATQFHPEKSQRTGARLLDNFLRYAREAA
jgi:imidazole glycerol-phosphate synthase subunit HisH